MKKIIAIVGFLSGLIAAVSAVFYKIYLCTGKPKFPGVDTEKYRRWLKTVKYDDRYITSRDGLYLHASAVKNSGDRWAVIMHGYDSEGNNMAEFAEHFYSIGYNVIMPDQRGFGLSEGNITTMGHKEQLDVLEWIGYLNRVEKAGSIVLFGVSMGAATVMLVSGNKLPSNVKAIIEDCGYTSVFDEFKYNLKKMFNLPAFPFLYIVDIITRLKDGWSLLKDASCIESVRRSSVPMLFIHGSADDFVPYYMHDELYDAAVCPKEKLVIYGAGHVESMEREPEQYWSGIEAFLGKYC